MKVYDDGVNYRFWGIYTGTNKHSGKRWFKKIVTVNTSFKVRTLKNGRKYLYIWDVKGKHPVEVSLVKNSPAYPEPVLKAVRELCHREIGPTPAWVHQIDAPYPNIDLIYFSKPNALLFLPTMVSLGDSSYFASKGKYSLRTSDPTSIFKKMLKDRYSKKLSGLLRGKVDPDTLLVISECPPEIKSEWIIDYVKESRKKGVVKFPSFGNNTFRSVPSSLIRKVFIDATNSRYYVLDSLRMLDKLIDSGVEIDVKSILKKHAKEYHDILVELELELRDKMFSTPFEHSITLPEEVISAGFRLPESPKDLHGWATLFGNCVYSYRQQVKTGESIILNRNDHVCIEISSDGVLRQYLGKFNRSVSPEDFWEGVNILLESGIIKSEPNDLCWGYQPALEKV